MKKTQSSWFNPVLLSFLVSFGVAGTNPTGTYQPK
jgi:hypothetical protein